MLRLILSVMTMWIHLACCYNLEPRLPLYKRGTNGSSFGFSLAMHKTSSESQSELDHSLLVIGSPTASAISIQRNTKKPGGIFTCPVTTNPNDCTRVQMDAGRSTKDDNKSGQWLGVSVKSQGPGQYVVTCAHRYSRTFGSGEYEIERLCGKCFLLNGTNSGGLREITPKETNGRFTASPCDKKPPAPTLLNSKNALAYAQSGASIAIINTEYLSGAPGMWAWAGGMFDFELPNLNTAAVGMFTDASGMYETQGCNPSEYQRDRAKTKCDKIPLRRDSYMGFSVAASDAMVPGSSQVTYIAGSPRGNYTGAVVLYRRGLDSLSNEYLIPMLDDVIMGEFIGSSFGFSVATTDLNNDGLDDLIVGAPQYYQYNNDGKYGGAVYVYINEGLRPFSDMEPQTLYGPLDSFFGYSVAPIGDIDQDGFNDFAVGAPHEKPSGKIYIYRGSADGTVKLSQTLNGEDLTGVIPHITGFGISLSGQVDIDNNKYPDLLVGTLADHAILFRSRPIISVNSSFEVSTKMIDLKQPSCAYNGKNYSCFDIRLCFSYASRFKDYKGALALKYTVTLDSELQQEKKASRVHFNSPDDRSRVNRVVSLRSAGKELCPPSFTRIYFGKTVIDRLRPVKLDFEFHLKSDDVEISPENLNDPVFPMINDPILDSDYINHRTASVTLMNNCGSDGCQSNLTVNGSLPPEVVIGAESKTILTLKVSNYGEEAHQAYVTAKLPPRVYYDGYKISKPSTADIECVPSESRGIAFVTCSLGNPYDGGSDDELAITLDVSQLDVSTKEIVVEISGSTTSVNPDLVPFKLNSKVVVEMHLSLTSFGHPPQVRYIDAPIIGESAIQHTDNIGPLLEYTFNIKNDGVQLAKGIKLNIHFPIEIKNGKWLLYLVSTKVQAGGSQVAGECAETHINPLKFNLPIISTRQKRQVSSFLYNPRRTSLLGSKLTASVVSLDCPSKTARCVTIDCTLEPLNPGSTTSVQLRARLWNNTFLEELKNVDLVRVGSYGRLSNIEPNVRIVTTQNTSEIVTTVDHAFFGEDAISIFPWWWILVAVIFAFVVYMIIICLLVKCGFFRRKRYHRERHQTEDRVQEVEEHPTSSRSEGRA